MATYLVAWRKKRGRSVIYGLVNAKSASAARKRVEANGNKVLKVSRATV